MMFQRAICARVSAVTTTARALWRAAPASAPGGWRWPMTADRVSVSDSFFCWFFSLMSSLLVCCKYWPVTFSNGSTRLERVTTKNLTNTSGFSMFPTFRPQWMWRVGLLWPEMWKHWLCQRGWKLQVQLRRGLWSEQVIRWGADVPSKKELPQNECDVH